ncbi:MAG: hypothetical protein ACTS8Z_02415, partial [Candidatus Limnocylindrales bacterium]
DFGNPAILIYEPQADGGMELVAVENLVFVAAWEAAGVRDILSKIYGSTNPVNVTRATIEALRGLHSAEELSARRGVKLVSRISGQPAPTAEAVDGR